MTETIVNEAIDAVILWVDGADPVHAEKLNNYLASIGSVRPAAASKTRFHNAGEIDYCLTSLLKFAPWLRTIYIVTDNQRPSLMDKITGSVFEKKVKVVDHSEIFAGHEDCLPSFNSMAISSLLWRIPGLAEQFIYFNDDFVIVRPVSPDDFFSNGKVILRGRWKRLSASVPGSKVFKALRNFLGGGRKKNRISFWGLQQQCAELLGFKSRYFRLPHVPHPWKKSTWNELFLQFPEAMSKNIKAHLRVPDQYVPEGLSSHFHLKNNLAVVNTAPVNVQLKPADQSLLRIKMKLNNADKNESIIFACVQSIETAPEEKRQLIFNWLDKRVGKLDDLLI
ncbi:stealth family protein [Cellvibrio fontiphilus]|jgi:hypothetical protein|uniref:Stealth family protein n=1 Tax=Cellvibrio fontiphilus TaxID=1815559 RepID=A0ABV7FI73_9GAMM